MVDIVVGVDVDVVEVLAVVSKVDSNLRTQVMAKLVEDQEEVMVVVVVETEVELDEDSKEEKYQKLV